MSTFTLAISCLTTSNFPWSMDLTFQVPMQYCSLQHRTLLLSPTTSTTGYCFCFGSIHSFFLELFLHWSLVAYWAPTDLGSPSFSIIQTNAADSFKLRCGFCRWERQWSWDRLKGIEYNAELWIPSQYVIIDRVMTFLKTIKENYEIYTFLNTVNKQMGYHSFYLTLYYLS